MYCLDTDTLSALCRADPPTTLIRRLGSVPLQDQCTTAINVAEMLYGVARRGSDALLKAVRDVLMAAGRILPFDAAAAEIYGPLRARLETEGKPLAEPDLRIASIALAHGCVLVSGNTKHFARVPGLVVEDWLRGPRA